jgi:hypothetical protein
MTISRISDQLVNTNTLTPSAHVAGDFFIASLYRLSGVTTITVPSGWLRLGGPTGANATNRVMACKWAASTAEAFGTWTNAEFASLTIYRGTTGLVVPGTNASVVVGSSLTLAFGALTLRQQDGTAWVHGSAGISTTDTDLETPPTGFTLLDNLAGATGEVSIFDSNAGVASFTGNTRTMSGTAGNLCRQHVELFETTYLPSSGGQRSWAHLLG